MSKDEALAWFRLGFETSGEGCNGEFMRLRSGLTYEEVTAAWFEEKWTEIATERAEAEVPPGFVGTVDELEAYLADD